MVSQWSLIANMAWFLKSAASITLISMWIWCPIGNLCSHGDLQTASVAMEVKCDLRIDSSNLNYPWHQYAYCLKQPFCDRWGHSSLHMTSEVTSDLKFELSGLNNPCFSVFVAPAQLYLTNTDGWEEEAKCHPLTRFALWRSLVKISSTVEIYLCQWN